jgi:hypothetical protein
VHYLAHLLLCREYENQSSTDWEAAAYSSTLLYVCSAHVYK